MFGIFKLFAFSLYANCEEETNLAKDGTEFSFHPRKFLILDKLLIRQ